MTDKPTITQADIDAAHGQVMKGYQTAYDYEMDLRQSFAAHRNRASTVCDCDPSSVKENKAGGMWYRRWYKAQHEVMALQKRLNVLASHRESAVAELQAEVERKDAALWKIARNEDATYSRELARAALAQKEPVK